MAKYTYTLREIVSTFGEDEVKGWFEDYELSDYLTPEEISVIETRGVWSKDQLATRIIRHYLNREVGSEGIGKFQLDAKDLMAELMETYAPLLYSASLKYDPLVNVDFSETFDRDSSSTSKSNSTTNSNTSGLGVDSDTPQGQISKNAILQGNYASSTSASESESRTNGASENTGDGREHYVRTTRGNSGVSATAQKMVEQYRDNIRAINTEIVYALDPLFMSIF